MKENPTLFQLAFLPAKFKAFVLCFQVPHSNNTWGEFAVDVCTLFKSKTVTDNDKNNSNNMYDKNNIIWYHQE